MINPQITEYIKNGLENGHNIDDLADALVENGWDEKEVKKAALFASAPKNAPEEPTKEEKKSPKPKREVIRIPDHYTSSVSILLAIILFFAVLSFTNQLTADIIGKVAPHAPTHVTQTAPYRQLLEQEDTTSILPNDPRRIQLQEQHDEHHTAHKARALMVTGIVSVAFWIIAFLIHLSVSDNKKQFYVLSMPYFFVAGIYLATLLIDTFSMLFATEAAYAVYFTFGLIIVVATVAFILYQKRHNSSQQTL